MPNAKDKAFHADGSMTAAEYKRRFLNKKAVQRASSQVEVRTNMAHVKGVTKADKARLRNVHIRQEAMPGDFYKPGNIAAPELRSGRNRAHIITSI